MTAADHKPPRMVAKHRRFRPPGSTSGRLAAELPAEVAEHLRALRAAEPPSGYRHNLVGGREGRAELDHYVLELYTRGWSSQVICRAAGWQTRQAIHNRVARAMENPWPHPAKVPVPDPPPARAEVEQAAVAARVAAKKKRTHVDPVVAERYGQLQEVSRFYLRYGLAASRAASADMDEIVRQLIDDLRIDRQVVAAALGYTDFWNGALVKRLRRGRRAQVATVGRDGLELAA